MEAIKNIYPRVRHGCTIFLAVTVILAGCVPRDTGNDNDTVDSEVTDIVNEHKKIMSALDADCGLFDRVLATTEDYLEGRTTQEEALSVVDEALETYQTALDAWEPYSLPEGMADVLEAHDIIPEEFELFGNFRGEWLQHDIDVLEVIRTDLAYVGVYDFPRENLTFRVNLQKRFQDAIRGYYYYAYINLWFAGWDAESTAYVQEQDVAAMEYSVPEGCSWETDREVILQKAMRYLDEIEECIRETGAHNASQQEELYRQEKELGY